MRTQRNDSVKGYKIDFTNNTLIMNYQFAKAVQDYGSPEYIRLQSILADFPTMKTVVKAGRTITTTRPNKRLTYANMITHMKCYKNSEELIEAFESVKALSSTLASPYKYVCDWFIAQFPNYKNVSASLEATGNVLPVASAPSLANYAQKETIYSA